ncbi:unnamed protein product [Boreogadus saida]
MEVCCYVKEKASAQAPASQAVRERRRRVQSVRGVPAARSALLFFYLFFFLFIPTLLKGDRITATPRDAIGMR